MLQYALRSLIARPRRTLMTAVAVVVAVSMITGTFVLTDTIRAAFDQLFTQSTQGAQVLVASRQAFSAAPSAQTPASAPASLVQRIRSIPDVAAAEGQVRDSATILGRDGKPIASNGLPTSAISYTPAPFSGLQFLAGRPPVGPRQVAIDQSVAISQHYRVGDQVPILTGQPLRRFTISGIARIGKDAVAGAPFVTFDLATTQALYGKDGAVDRIYVRGQPDLPTATLIDQIRPLLGGELVARAPSQQVDTDMQQLSAQLSVLRHGLLVLVLVAIVVAAFVIFNSMSITVAQRTQELALLRSVGATRRQVFGLVLAETTSCAVIASLVGLAGGVVAAAGARGLLGLSGLEPPSTALVLGPRTAMIGVGVGIATALAAAVIPAKRATNVSPLEALRNGATARARPRLQFGVRAIRAAAWPITRRGTILARLATENAARNPARTAISASSLMIGLAAVLAVTIYASGLRAGAQRTVGRTFLGNFAIQSEDGASPIPATSVRAVAETPGVLLAGSIKSAPARIAGARTTAEGFDPTTIGSLYRFDWIAGAAGNLPDLGPDDVVVERATARAAHVGLGDHLLVQSETGARARFVVRGIYSDHALLSGIAVPFSGFDGLFHQSRLQDLFVKLSPGADPRASFSALTNSLRSYPGVVVRSEPDLADQVARRVNTILVLFYALLAVSVATSLLGIVNTLSLSIHERTRELGVLRAFGMTPSQVRTLIRRESLVTATLGTIFGLAAGFPIAWAVVEIRASDGVVFVPPWALIGLLLVLGLSAGLLAAGPPARRAVRLNLVEAIAEE